MTYAVLRTPLDKSAVLRRVFPDVTVYADANHEYRLFATPGDALSLLTMDDALVETFERLSDAEEFISLDADDTLEKRP